MRRVRNNYFYRLPEVFYINLILRIVSPEGPVVETKEAGQFFVFSNHLESSITQS